MSLLSMSTQAGIMIAVVTLIRAFALNHLPKRTFLALWMIVLLRLLIPFSLSSPLSIYSLANQTGLSVPVPVTHFQSLTVPPQNALTSPAPELSMWTLIWTAGAILCALYFIISYVRCLREFHDSQIVNHDFTANWLTENILKRPIQIRQSSSISAPLTYGIFRPVILMPEQTDWTDTRTLQVILTHELMHIRSFDTVTKILFAAALCVHWFNPLVWIMFLLVNRDIELSCDEAVVHSFGNSIKSAYALILIHMEEQKNRLLPFCNNFSKNPSEERIKAIMKTKKTSIAALITALVLVGGITIIFATSGAAKSAKYTKSAKSNMDNTGIETNADYIFLQEIDTYKPSMKSNNDNTIIKSDAGVVFVQKIDTYKLSMKSK